MHATKYLNLTQAARRLGITRATLRKWIRKGAVPAVRNPSGQVRVHEDDLQLVHRPLDPEESKDDGSDDDPIGEVDWNFWGRK